MVEEREGREEVKTQEKQGRASGQGHLSFSESRRRSPGPILTSRKWPLSCFRFGNISELMCPWGGQRLGQGVQTVLHEYRAGCRSLWGEMKDFAVCQTLPNPRQPSPDGPAAESGVSQMVPRGMLAPRGKNYSENILRTLLRKHC